MQIHTAAIALLALLLLTGECLAESGFTLNGRYEYRTDSESIKMHGSLVCFYPSPESAKLLPRLKSDKRLAWFCFKNEAQSKKLLRIPVENNKARSGFTGVATVRVVDYTAYLGEGDGFDTAVLQSVSGSFKTKALPCK